MEHSVEVITWIDHSHSMGDERWSQGELNEEAATEMSVVTVGFIVAETNKQVIQVTEIVPPGEHYRRWWRIRKELIVSRQLWVPKES